MSSLPVVFDLDGVAFDIVTPMKALAPHLFNRPLVAPECLADVFGNSENLLQFMIENKILETAPVYDGVPEAIARIREKHPVIILSARDFHPDGWSVTHDALTRNGIEFDELHVTMPGVPKSELYSRWGTRFKAIVEDTPSNLDDAHESGLFEHMFCRAQSWNKGYAKGAVVSCIGQVADALVGTKY